MQACYVPPMTDMRSSDCGPKIAAGAGCQSEGPRGSSIPRFLSKRFVSEATHTVIANEHGALILLAASVEVNQIIRLENPNLGEELLCRVTGLGPSFMGKTQVAIELIMPTPGFWGTGSTSKTPDLG